MKLLITAPTYAPASDGVANAARVHATGLAARGHDVTVATAAVPETPDEETVAGVKIMRFRVAGSAHPLIRVRGEVSKYRDYVRSFDADAVLCHCWQAWNTELVFPALAETRAKKVLVSHGVSANSHVGPKGWAHWLAYRPYVWRRIPSILRSLDHLVVLADRADGDRFLDRRLASTLGYPRCSIIPNGTDLAAHDAADKSFAERHGITDKSIVLSVGKYHPLKNELAIVRAFCRARPENSALVMIGPADNDYLARLKRVVAGAHLPRSSQVLFLVGCDQAEILAAYQAASVFVMASRTECFPLVLLDAMASSTAFISTDVGCVSTLPGGIVVARDAQLGAELSLLLRDRARREGLAREGRRACEERFNWSTVVRQYDELCTSL